VYLSSLGSCLLLRPDAVLQVFFDPPAFPSFLKDRRTGLVLPLFFDAFWLNHGLRMPPPFPLKLIL